MVKVEKFKEAYNKNRKNGQEAVGDVGSKVSNALTNWWFVFPLTLAIIVSLFVVINHQSQMNKLTSTRDKMMNQVKKSNAELKTLKDGLKPEVVKRVVEKKAYSSQEAGDNLAKAITVLGTAYNTATAKDISEEQREKAKSIIDKYVVESEAEAQKLMPWVKTKDWTLTFNSKASFEKDMFGVIFVMKDSKGHVMGIVTADYSATVDQFKNINVSYTEEGFKVSDGRSAA